MSHPVTVGSHSRLHQHLLSGNKINIQGYSHTVCVRKEHVDSWIKNGYETIEDGGDTILVGKKKAGKTISA